VILKAKSGVIKPAKPEAPVGSETLGVTRMANKTQFINRIRFLDTKLLETLEDIHNAEVERVALGLSFADEDFSGANEGITAAQFGNAVTNLASIRNAVFEGGTLPAFLPGTLYQIKE
jgi:hypothetical protein